MSGTTVGDHRPHLFLERGARRPDTGHGAHLGELLLERGSGAGEGAGGGGGGELGLDPRGCAHLEEQGGGCRHLGLEGGTTPPAQHAPARGGDLILECAHHPRST